VEEVHFLDKQNGFIFYGGRHDGPLIMSMFEIDPGTETIRFKSDCLLGQDMYPRAVHNYGNQLLLIYPIDSPKSIKYSLYKFDVKSTKIEKCHEAQSSYLDYFYASFFESKILSFDGYCHAKNTGPLKQVFCFDLTTNELNRFDLKLPESINEIQTPETVCLILN
jgi:hypothetical protein